MTRHLDRLVLGGFAVVVAVITALLLARGASHVSGVYGEGWNAYHVQNLLAGRPLYWPADGWLTNNYPPLSFLAVGALSLLGPDPLMAGRLLAGAGFIACAALIFLIVRRASADRFAALAAAVTYAGTIAVNFEWYVGISDPSFPGQALGLAGMLVLLRSPAHARAQVAAALCMTLGLLVKHNMVALPLAVTLWLLCTDWRGFLRFSVTGIAAMALGLGVSALVFGPDFWTSLLTPRPWTVLQGARHALLWISPLKPFVVFALLAAAVPGDRVPRLFALTFVMALLLGVVQLLGRGTGPNCLFEAVAAGALCGGMVLARWTPPGGVQRVLVRAAIAGGLGVTALFGPDMALLRTALPWVSDAVARDAAVTSAVVSRLASAGGPVLCEKIVYCYWAGQELVVEPFNYGQKVLTGHMDQAPLVARITARGFRAIAIEGTEAEHAGSLYFAPVWDAVVQNYRAVPGEFGTTTVFVPRD